MKKIFLLMIVALMLSSCASVMRIGNSVVWAKNEYQAKERVASRKIVEYVDRNSGITVSKSEYIDYAYGLYFGNLRIINQQSYIEVKQYNGVWNLIETISREGVREHKYNASTNQVPQRVLVNVRGGSAYITVYQGNLIVGNYKM